MPNIAKSLLGRLGMGALPRAAGSALLFNDIAPETIGMEYTNPATPAVTKIMPTMKFLGLITA